MPETFKIHYCKKGYFFKAQGGMFGPFKTQISAEVHEQIYADWLNKKLPYDYQHKCEDCKNITVSIEHKCED